MFSNFRNMVMFARWLRGVNCVMFLIEFRCIRCKLIINNRIIITFVDAVTATIYSGSSAICKLLSHACCERVLNV